tara:strand:- start:1202 stop:1726 length:525 start_codon:yes stop_codon:yes gene_type:complete
MIATYSHSRNEIKGYNNSKIASGEKQDCVVRAMASALDVDYDSAHGLVKSTMNRENNKGTKNFEIVKAMRKFKKEGLEIAGKKFDVDLLGKSRIRNTYKLHGELIDRKKTVKSFIQDNDKGTFVVLVSKHAFTVKDGVLIDNVGEEFRPTRKVLGAFSMKLVEDNVSGEQLMLF